MVLGVALVVVSGAAIYSGPITAATTRSMPSAPARATAARLALVTARSRTCLCHGARVLRSSPTMRKVMSRVPVRGGGSLGACESVLLHDLAERGVVRGAAGGGVEDRGDLAEVIGG